MKKFINSFLTISIILPTILFSDIQLPEHTGNAVNDFAGVISSYYERKINDLSREVLQKTGTSIVVATVETLNDMNIEQYSTRLFEKWGIGKKGEDKGLLFLLAMKERKIRIEVGYGVEYIITDGMAGQILDQYVIPEFSQGNYGKGFYQGAVYSAGLIAEENDVTITGMPAVTTRTSRTSEEQGGGGIIPILIILFLIIITRGRILPWLFLGLLMGGGGRGRSSGGGFGGGFGGFGGGMSGGGGASRGF